MINAAAAFPQKFGLEFWKDSGKDQFAAIDENGDGAVSFDEWLGFAYNHYKTQSLATAFDKLDKDAFVKDCKNVGDTSSESYKKIYWFSWKCFQVMTSYKNVVMVMNGGYRFCVAFSCWRIALNRIQSQSS